MSATTASMQSEMVGSQYTGLSYYFQHWKKAALAALAITVVMVFAAIYQRTFGHLYGLDAHAAEFNSYWMNFFYSEVVLMAILAVSVWTFLWVTREPAAKVLALTPREELQRYFTYVLWLAVYTWAVYFAGSFFAEQDASWHQVVTRDTSFTPNHIVLFYGTFPLYIVLGVGSLLYGLTRLPMMVKNGVSVPHLLAVVGPFMILPNVGLNEWGHAFWFMEEIFTAPLHWGFVVLGWTALGLGGVLLQITLRANELLPKLSEG